MIATSDKFIVITKGAQRNRVAFVRSETTEMYFAAFAPNREASLIHKNEARLATPEEVALATKTRRHADYGSIAPTEKRAINDPQPGLEISEKLQARAERAEKLLEEILRRGALSEAYDESIRHLLERRFQ